MICYRKQQYRRWKTRGGPKTLSPIFFSSFMRRSTWPVNGARYFYSCLRHLWKALHNIFCFCGMLRYKFITCYFSITYLFTCLMLTAALLWATSSSYKVVYHSLWRITTTHLFSKFIVFFIVLFIFASLLPSLFFLELSTLSNTRNTFVRCAIPSGQFKWSDVRSHVDDTHIDSRRYLGQMI